jgi:5-formyltetrahydrofolate cyclo-ligase
MPLAAIQGAKFELRRSALAQRNETAAKRGPLAAQALAAQIQNAMPEPQGLIIAGYWPLGSELDCRPAMRDLCARGGRLCLPVAGQRGDRLIFRQWTPEAQLETGPFGTSHPPATAPTIEPTIILVPLLAFDDQCRRLGYGAAYYDRTLSLIRRERSVAAIGVAFAEQQVVSVPVEPTDVVLDAVLTDQGLLYPAAPQKDRP